MCPHTATCVLTRLHVSSYYYICLRIPLHMGAHTIVYMCVFKPTRNWQERKRLREEEEFKEEELRQNEQPPQGSKGSLAKGGKLASSPKKKSARGPNKGN
jgi:hypothetical protein